ncbi:ATP-binding cassette domain-containing protein [Actinomyces viscosus]|uniref:ATP-binding cassette domain-containing protein n=1 Tax=Actinomyces viscosus TaxID=1656 RepID=UPI000F83A4EF|nr:ATP-binding cassette domain-containing protein [Actinomyces viscosus]TFH53232.1 ATP-binding cassette domain-containing protein [Actinomyces viscosus]
MRVENLSVHYLGHETWVLKSVDLTHLSGQVTAVIGPSGCGKTTLVRALCGLVPHCLPSEYAGSLKLAGTEVADATVQSLAETVAYVGQSPDAAVVTRTVHDDVAFPLQNLCLPRPEITSRVEEALRAVGLTERIWDDPWTLSGGQRQRLAVAVALAMRPRLLVLDEPTSTIDTTGREEFYALISSLTASGTAVVVIDHDLDPVLPIVNQVLALDAAGRTIAVGSPREVFTGHRRELIDAGVWMPRALRDVDEGVPAGSSGPEAPLTCSDAGIRVPLLTDLCAEGKVRYLEKQIRNSDESWEEVEAIDTHEVLAGRTRSEPRTSVELVDLEVPGRSPRVSMRLGGGELVALVGPNGAGKSSILSSLAGLVRSTGSRAVVGGREVGKGKHLVGYVFQNPEHQFVGTTVGAELAVGGTPPARVDQLLEQFHLTSHRDHHPLTLSGGQARRLSVATMVSEERDVVVLDEPTYGQDWDNTRELMGFIDQLRDQGRTVIMATHDLELALRHCTHLIALPQPAPRSAGGMESVEEAAEVDGVAATAMPVATGAAAPPPGPGGGIPVPPRPQPRRGLFTSLNPLTLFLAVLPAMVMVFALRNHHLNLEILLICSILVVAARASLRRTIASAIAPWAVSALMIWIFSAGHRQEDAARLYDLGNAVTGGTGIGALVALVLVSGVSTDPDALIRTLTTTFRMPYRLGAAGTAAIAFITRFHEDFVLLRTARALRGIGCRWGLLAPVVRWAGSILPLMILAVQHAERVALSMDSRAFGAHRRRTEMTDEPWRVRDWGVVVLTWALVAITWNTRR